MTLDLGMNVQWRIESGEGLYECIAPNCVQIDLKQRNYSTVRSLTHSAENAIVNLIIGRDRNREANHLKSTFYSLLKAARAVIGKRSFVSNSFTATHEFTY